MLPLNAVYTPKRRIRARGRIRVEQLQEAAMELLAAHELTALTFKDVYERAGIPPGSAYHFFDNIESLFLSIVERSQADLLEYVAESAVLENVTTWMDLLDILVDRAVEFYNINIASRRILTQSGINMGVVLDVDKRSGIKLEEVFDRHFILPEMPDRTNFFVMAGKVAYLFITISISQYGNVVDDLRIEIKAAMKGYLKMHLPEMLTKRQ